jgi:hypothetical protein
MNTSFQLPFGIELECYISPKHSKNTNPTLYGQKRKPSTGIPNLSRDALELPDFYTPKPYPKLAEYGRIGG